MPDVSHPFTDGGRINPVWHRVLSDVVRQSNAVKALANQILVGAVPVESLIFVNSVSDFPEAVGGVITLGDNVTYFVTDTIDLAGSRLVAGQNTVIIGGSSENCRLKSTGLTGTALITSQWSLPMRFISIEADVALDLDAGANANQALDWFGVNFVDCANVGTIANYANFIMTDSATLNSQGMTFDGTIGTIAMTQCFISPSAGGTFLTLPATLTVSRRFRMIYSSLVIEPGETGLNVSSSASIPVEGYILDNCNFSGGGTYTTGLTFSDNKTRWDNNRGISNSAAIGYMYMQNNATATTIAVAGTAYKAAGTTTNATITQKFTHTSNRLTYIGARERDFRMAVSATITSGTGNQIGLYVAKNGVVVADSESYVTANASGRAESGHCQTILALDTNDYVEFWVENASGTTSVVVEFLSFVAEALN